MNSRKFSRFAMSWLGLGWLVFFSNSAMAVENKSNIQPPYRLVGAISGNQKAGDNVAILHDENLNQSLVVRLGDRFGAAKDFSLKEIGDKHVILQQDGQPPLRLEYTPWSQQKRQDEQEVQESVTVDASDVIAPVEPKFNDPEILSKESALSQAQYSALYLKYLNSLLQNPELAEDEEYLEQVGENFSIESEFAGQNGLDEL